MIDIAIKNLAKSFGAFQVLTDINLEIHSRERVGLIGNNGTGKTTIFKIIAGLDHPDQGDIFLRKELKIGYLQQIPEFPRGYTVDRVIKLSFAEHYRIAAKLRQLEQDISRSTGERLDQAVQTYGQLQEEFEHMEGYQIDAKIDKICNGLGIDQSLRSREFSLLSGGEQTTVMLAQLLLEKPDILLLDEPSNHLDVDSLEWLEEYLQNYPGSVWVISHDRYFLDRVVSRIIEVEDGECRSYIGNYTAYAKQKEDRLLEQFAQYQDQQKKIKAMKKAIKDMKEWGNRADNPKFHKRAASMQKRLDKMERIDRPILEKSTIQLGFGDGGRSGNDVFELADLDFSFANQPIVRNAQMVLGYGERVALVGSNGSGKTTLLKLLLGEFQPQRGQVKQGSRVKVGYCEQQVKFADEQLSVIETFRHSYPSTHGQARNILAKFHFFGEDVFKRVSALSGGERSRLRLCQLVHEDINVLILDEPTNHLDIDSIEMLEDALLEFKGTMLFVSHDRYFINRICQRVVELVDLGLREYLGDYDYYRTKRAERSLPKPAKVVKRSSNIQRPVVKASTMNRSTQLEQEIHYLEELITKKRMEASNWASDYAKLTEIEEETARLQTNLDTLLEEWTELAE